jgi:hypothetical protein
VTSALLDIIHNTLIHPGDSPPTPSPASRRRQAYRHSSLLTNCHQGATAFKPLGLGINLHIPPIKPSPHSLPSLSDDPSHDIDLNLAWRTPRQTEDSTASFFSYTSSSDDDDSSAADSSIAQSDDDSSVEFDMAIELASPPPRRSRDRNSVQTSPLTLSGLYMASPPPTIVPLSRRDRLQRTPKRSCKPGCSCRIERDSRGRAYHEDALMLAATNEIYESPYERQGDTSRSAESQMIFPRPLWKLLEHPSPLVASNAACLTPQLAWVSRKYVPGRRDLWEDEGNPFLLTKYDFTPYRELRPRFKKEHEESSPVQWSPPISPSIQMSPTFPAWSLGTHFGLGISLEGSQFAASMGLGLGLLS